MMTEINPDKIKEIRKKRGQTQTEFGLEIYDTTPGTAQKLVSQLENGIIEPGKAASRTLKRLRQDHQDS